MSFDDIFGLLVIQAAQVAIVAGVAWLLVRLFANDRPHLAHALWAVVLLKSITPPVFASPTSPFSWIGLPGDRSPPMVTSKNEADLALRVLPEQPNIQWSVKDVPVVAQAARGSELQGDIAIEKSRSFALVGKSLLVQLWCLGLVCVAAVTALRVSTFAARVHRSTVQTPPQLTQMVERLRRQLRVKCKVRIQVVDGGIGPAVIGLLYPTLLLPKFVVEGQPLARIEPLVAHELVHIRRGDLWWALVQSLSLCICWFHPLVWCAHRWLTHESERSCDEETIASLGCQPATYARSLLDILEQKQLLRSAPSLPGIRPVDVTANRMERIMRLGHGCHARSPWWVLGTLLVGTALVLPGAELVIGQEGEPTPPAKIFPNPMPAAAAAPEDLKASLRVPSRLPMLPEAPYLGRLSSTSDEPYALESFEVAEVLQKLQDDTGVDAEQASEALIERLPFSQLKTEEGSTTSNRATAQFVVEGTDEVCVLGDTEPTMKVVGDKLFVFETLARREQIRQTIAGYRKFGFKLISIQADIVELRSTDLKRLGIFQQVGPVRTASAPRVADFSIPASHATEGKRQLPFKIISAEEEKRLLEFAKSGNEAQRIGRPSIATLNGHNASCRTGQSFEVTSDYRKNSQDGTYEPVKTHVEASVRLDVTPNIAPIFRGDENGKVSTVVEKLQLVGALRRSDIHRIDETAWSGGDGTLKIQVPKTSSSFADFSILLGKEERLAVAMHHKDEDGTEKATVAILRCNIPPPMAIPAVGLKVEELQGATVGVSDALTDAEFAAFEKGLKSIGVANYRRVDGRMTIAIDEGDSMDDFRVKHQAAARFFQTLRSQRASAKRQVSSVEDTARESSTKINQY